LENTESRKVDFVEGFALQRRRHLLGTKSPKIRSPHWNCLTVANTKKANGKNFRVRQREAEAAELTQVADWALLLPKGERSEPCPFGEAKAASGERSEQVAHSGWGF